VSIHAADGRLVRRLLEADLPAGSHEAVWDGRDAQGAAVASGVYVSRLQAGREVRTQKLVLMK
jgi:flagellar hook assembly protein FlgD